MKKLLFLFVILINQSFAQTECMDLVNYTNQYLDFVSTDDVTFPPGSPFISQGGLNYVKIDENDVYQTINGDTLSFSGDLGVNVQFFDCSNYLIVFSANNLTTLSVDGTSVFTNGNISTSFTGPGFTFQSNGVDSFSLQGTFTNLVLSAPSGTIYGLCFTCEGMGISENTQGINCYPNPVNDILYLDNLGFESQEFSLFNFSGQKINSGTVDGNHPIIDFSNLNNGIFYIQFENEGKTTSPVKILKN